MDGLVLRALTPTSDQGTPHSGTWIARNNMQSGSFCDEDPALPGLVTLIRPLQEVACDFLK